MPMPFVYKKSKNPNKLPTESSGALNAHAVMNRGEDGEIPWESSIRGGVFEPSTWEDFAAGLDCALLLLEGIAELHPFAKAAVGAFRTAAQYELKRRANDRRVVMLFAELRIMMLASSRLDGQRTTDTKIEKALKKLFDDTAKFIEDCSVYCSSFQSQSKFLKWANARTIEENLSDRIAKAERRGREIERYLDELFRAKIDRIDATVQNLERWSLKLDRDGDGKATKYGRELAARRPSQDRQLSEFIDRHGGIDTVVKNPALLQQMSALNGRTIDEDTLKDLGSPESFNERVRSSGEQFERLFRTFTGYLEHRDGITAGWTTLIAHPDVREVWEGMGWKLTVHPEELFVALQEFYTIRYSSLVAPKGISEQGSKTLLQDSGSVVPSQQPPNHADTNQPEPTIGRHAKVAATPFEEPSTTITISSEASRDDADALGEEDVQELADCGEGVGVLGAVPDDSEDYATGADCSVDPSIDYGAPDVDPTVAEEATGSLETELEVAVGRPSAESEGVGGSQSIGGAPPTSRPDNAKHGGRKFLAGILPQDAWTLQHISVQGLHCLFEVLDPDASSFVTVAEINAFTASCPRSWRLPQLLAYWTSGIPISLQRYSLYIRTTLRYFLDAAQKPSEGYATLASAGRKWALHVERCIAGLESQRFMHIPFDDELYMKFADHIGDSEREMTSFLSKISWGLESSSAVELLIGDSEIDHRFLILVYVVTGRLVKAMRQSTYEDARPRELELLCNTMNAIMEAMYRRLENLKGRIYDQASNDEKLVRLGYGMYYYLNHPLNFHHSEQGRFFQSVFNAPRDKANSQGLDALDPIELGPVFIPSNHTRDSRSIAYPASDHHTPIIGSWTGIYRPNRKPQPEGVTGTPIYSLGRVDIRRDSSGAVSGFWSNVEGDFLLKGQSDQDGDEVGFIAKSTGKNRSYRVYEFKGRLKDGVDRIEGSFYQLDSTSASVSGSERSTSPHSSQPPREPLESQASLASICSRGDDSEGTLDKRSNPVLRGSFALVRVLPDSAPASSSPSSDRIPPLWSESAWKARYEAIPDAKERYLQLYQKCYYSAVLSIIQQLPRKSTTHQLLTDSNLRDMQAIELVCAPSEVEQLRYHGAETLVTALTAQTRRYWCQICKACVELDYVLHGYRLEEDRDIKLCPKCAPFTVNPALPSSPGHEQLHDSTVSGELLLKDYALYQVRRALSKRETQETRLRAAEVLSPGCTEPGMENDTDLSPCLPKRCVMCAGILAEAFWRCVDCADPIGSCISCRNKPIPLAFINKDEHRQQLASMVGKSTAHLWSHTMVFWCPPVGSTAKNGADGDGYSSPLPSSPTSKRQRDLSATPTQRPPSKKRRTTLDAADFGEGSGVSHANTPVPSPRQNRPLRPSRSG